MTRKRLSSDKPLQGPEPEHGPATATLHEGQGFPWQGLL